MDFPAEARRVGCRAVCQAGCRHIGLVHHHSIIILLLGTHELRKGRGATCRYPGGDLGPAPLGEIRTYLQGVASSRNTGPIYERDSAGANDREQAEERSAVQRIRASCHFESIEAAIANTGPILPLLHEVTDQERANIGEAAKALLANN